MGINLEEKEAVKTTLKSGDDNTSTTTTTTTAKTSTTNETPSTITTWFESLVRQLPIPIKSIAIIEVDSTGKAKSDDIKLDIKVDEKKKVEKRASGGLKRAKRAIGL